MVTARGRWLGDDAMRKPVAVGMAVGRSSRMDAKVAAVKKEVKVGGDFETRGLFCAEEIAELRHRLLAWYDVNHRILPWRKNPHSKRSDRDAGPPPPEDKSDFAYCVWVSEGTLHYELRFSLIVRLELTQENTPSLTLRTLPSVMLQQTRVETVKAYYTRWMEAYPTLTDLAEADLERVNELWAGLGYYRRARFLLEGARHVRDKCGGRMPGEVEELHKIPGIGMYTASAIASIAFGRRAGVVDGNVIRVLSRLRALAGDPRAPANTKLHWRLSNSVVDADRPGCFNQALMELGATVCTPKAPKCGECPARAQCLALRRQEEWGADSEGGPSVTDFPEKVKKKPPRMETIRCCVLVVTSEGRGHFLLIKRPDKGLLAGLWEFPNVPVGAKTEEEGSKPPRGREELVGLLGEILEGGSLEAFTGKGAQKLKEVGSFEHVFSHIKQTTIVDMCSLQVDAKAFGTLSEMQGPRETRLVPVDSKEGVASLSTGVRKAIRLYSGLGKKASVSRKNKKKEGKAEADKSQRRLDQFFGKGARVKDEE